MATGKYYRTPYENRLADNVTLLVTDDCNLRCKYCYENKTHHNMSLQVGIDAVDYLFEHFNNRYDRVLLNFIGGEPFIVPELCEKLIERCMENLDKYPDKWKGAVFCFTTNGTCFKDKKVRDIIEKYNKYLSVGVSLDGCKEIHDLNRSNSFDELMKWFPYWRRTVPWGTTKSTLNHESLPYLFESVKFLFSTSLDDFYMNTVYEDVWKPGDTEIYYDQLIKIADWLVENKLYKTKTLSLFDAHILGMPNRNTDSNWCGCGSSMLAIDYKGDIFPCTRFKTLVKQKPLSIGNIYVNNGELDYNKLLPFYFCHNLRHTPGCDDCEAKSSCPNCTAFCYDETGSIFDRISYMCDMHKTRVKANYYYWNKVAENEGVTFEEMYQNNTSIDPMQNTLTVAYDLKDATPKKKCTDCKSCDCDK